MLLKLSPCLFPGFSALNTYLDNLPTLPVSVLYLGLYLTHASLYIHPPSYPHHLNTIPKPQSWRWSPVTSQQFSLMLRTKKSHSAHLYFFPLPLEMCSIQSQPCLMTVSPHHRPQTTVPALAPYSSLSYFISCL